MGNAIDLTGFRSSLLKVLRRSDKTDKGGAVYFTCLCDCGKIATVRSDHLRHSEITHCGCLRGRDITGERFGRLRAIHATTRKCGSVVWLCYCDCGTFTEVSRSNLVRKNTKSCGCLHHDIITSAVGELNVNWDPSITDEDRNSRRKNPEYLSWRKSVYERDNYTCQKCREIGGRLNAHHIESYAKNKELRTSLSNGITLCANCHRNLHHIYGNDTERDNLNEWMEG